MTRETADIVILGAGVMGTSIAYHVAQRRAYCPMDFKIAPAVGLVMSEVIVDGKSRTVDVRDFYPDRFTDEKPIRARYEYGDD